MRRLSLVALLAAVMIGRADRAGATAITFDSVITASVAGQPTPIPGIPGFIDEYMPLALNSSAFTTQGFTFGSFVAGTPNPTVVAGLGIMLDPSLCPSDFATDCASNTTHYLAASLLFSMSMTTLPSVFGISSFDASRLLADDTLCPTCNANLGVENAGRLQVYGLRSGAVVAQQTFTLSYGFQNYLLNNDADWANVGRVVFRPLDANGVAGVPGVDGCCHFALDNIQASPVPEPASIVLLGTGLAALIGRARRRTRT